MSGQVDRAHERQRALDEHHVMQAVLDIESGSRRYPDVIAKVVAPLIAAARAEGAADALREAAKYDDAQPIRWPGSSGEWLRARAVALSAHTTEGDPT